MSRSICCIAVVTVLLSGCREAARDRPITARDVQEASWEEEIAAVRSGESDAVRIADLSVSSEQFRELANGCDGLTTLVLDRAELTDEDLVVLASLPKLRWLKLPSPVGDDGAELIAACIALDKLNLPNGVFTDAALSHFASLEHLELMRFGSPNVTDAGLEELSRLPRLRFLHLLDVPITDAGLKHVAPIKTLESFYLDGGNATDAGLSKLLADRPDLHFHKDQRHLPNDPNAHPHD